MQIRYTLTRADMKTAVAAAWRLSNRFRITLLFVSAWPSAALLAVRVATRQLDTGDVVLAALLFVAFFALMLAMLILRTKTDERVLSIDATGIKTSIGAQQGEIPWRGVAAIESTADQLLIIGTSPNLFAIPAHAFPSNADRAAFAAAAERFRAAARA